MTSPNRLVLAVAGSRKTQGIVEACAAAPAHDRILVLTYTVNNQQELRSRLAKYAGDRPRIEVSGWFSFLISAYARPFVPFVFPGSRVRGFDYDSPPQAYTKVDDWSRYFNNDGEVRRVHLAQLATRIEDASNGIGAQRLARMYDRIIVDEIQDLCGYDLEVLRLLLLSNVPIEMVGDVRQAILATNHRERKNKKYMFMQVWRWFNEAKDAGLLRIEQRVETWRCQPEVAALADSLFDASWGFEPTVSRNDHETDHDGVFLVRPDDVDAYVDRYRPIVLRKSANSAKKFTHVNPVNFGTVKGLTSEHVLVCPTARIESFLKTGRPLDDQQAADFYVAITRAEQSVAIVLDEPGSSRFEVWKP